MTHPDEPKFKVEGREYDSITDWREAQAGREDRGRDVTYPVTSDDAERVIVGVEGLPDFENVVGEDDEDGQTNA